MTKLGREVAATLSDLRAVEWFRAVGTAGKSPSVLALESWDEAFSWNSEGTWEGVQLEAVNQFRNELLTTAIDEFRRWNDIVAAVRPVVIDLVQEKTGPILASQGTNEDFINAVQWDILHLVIEAEYARTIKPGFYAQLGYWYKEGHWPCGWDGPMKSGRLVVF